MRVLMVCLGNICRSPLAEGILQEKIISEGLNWEVDSAGTSSWHVGENPDPRSVEVAGRNGLDISRQRARQFTPDDFNSFDLIFAMDHSNYSDILDLAKSEQQKAKVKLILNEIFPEKNRAVPDPYWDNNFDEVYELLSQAANSIIIKYS